jgi:hypothetical protein
VFCDLEGHLHFVPKLCYEYKVCENGSFGFLEAFGFE